MGDKLAELTLKEADNEANKGLSLLYEKITSHQADQARMQLLQKTLDEFRALYADDQALTESITPEMKDAEYLQRVELAAWTMMTHSLLNLELAKVKR